jgi:hypothetical protein
MLNVDPLYGITMNAVMQNVILMNAVALHDVPTNSFWNILKLSKLFFSEPFGLVLLGDLVTMTWHFFASSRSHRVFVPGKPHNRLGSECFSVASNAGLYSTFYKTLY